MFAIISQLNMKRITDFCIVAVLLLSSLGIAAQNQNLYTTQAPLPCIDKKFTIVAHIVVDSLGQEMVDRAFIQESVDSLNAKFAPICASFEICEYHPIDNFQFDTLEIMAGTEWQELQDRHRRDFRINMYFVNTTDDPDAVCGFATPDGITMMEDGGIVLLKSCIYEGSLWMTHMMGHFFGLLHTFEGNGVELVDGSNCTTEGDLICDTPADPYVIGEPLANYVDVGLGCRFISGKSDANGAPYEPDVGNIMSFYQDECRCGFTYEQYTLMANTYLNSADKMW